MSSISAIGSSSNAWAAASSQRSQMQARMFAKVDADSSGSVDKAELQTMLADVDKKLGTSTSGSAAELMTKFDSNADGSLSSDELAKGMKDILPPPSTMDFAQSRTDDAGAAKTPSKALFAELDVNGDGSLDATELQVQNDRVQAETGQDTSDAFARLDSDGDGKLSTTEFAAGAPPAGGGSGGQRPGQANAGPPARRRWPPGCGWPTRRWRRVRQHVEQFHQLRRPGHQPGRRGLGNGAPGRRADAVRLHRRFHIVQPGDRYQHLRAGPLRATAVRAGCRQLVEPERRPAPSTRWPDDATAWPAPCMGWAGCRGAASVTATPTGPASDFRGLDGGAGGATLACLQSSGARAVPHGHTTLPARPRIA